jgi:phospholipase D1/2
MESDHSPTSPSIVDEGRNCWRVEPVNRACVIIDADDYYRIVRQAMMNAREQILLIGWDFDSRISLDPMGRAKDGAPVKLGRFLSWLARRRPGLQIYILKWDIGVLKLLWRGSTVIRVLRWVRNPQIHFKLDGAHSMAASHHHKIVVIDDSLAFCGGIDMTGARWDTRAHHDRDPGRKRPTGRPYPPWHDATMAVDGGVAKSLGELGRERWKVASGEDLPVPHQAEHIWPDGLGTDFRNAELAIARTRGQSDVADEVREIEAMFVDQIASARSFIYAETQYFASRRIAEAIAERLAEEDGPEFVIVNPKTADGWLEETVMGAARAQLIEQLEKVDVHGRFRIYTPVTAGGEDIYVHAKIMIVDDVMLRIGSANMNNRSMGLDSECDLVLDTRRPANRGFVDAIARMRAGLMAEHLGTSPEAVDAAVRDKGSLIAAVESLRGQGRTLVPFEPPEISEAAAKIAESEALDPEAADEPLARRRGLLHNLRRRARNRASRRATRRSSAASPA